MMVESDEDIHLISIYDALALSLEGVVLPTVAPLAQTSKYSFEAGYSRILEQLGRARGNYYLNYERCPRRTLWIK